MEAESESVKPAAAITVAAAAGLVGLVTSKAALASDEPFPSWGYLAGELTWNVVTLALTFTMVRRVHGHVTAARLGWSDDLGGTRPYPRAAAAATALVAVLLLVYTGQRASDAEAYGTVQSVTWALAAGELLLRYPLTAVVEEMLFRGWLQPRLGNLGPVISALLWAGFHLQQIATIPSLVIVGLLLGYVRWRTRSIRTSVGLHYLGDAGFFISAYLV